jgi:peptide/nickel transport system permease protein
MIRFLVKKLLGLLAVLLAVSAVVYFLGRGVTPGDIGTFIVGVDGATPAQIAHVRHQLNLDKPIYEAYLIWLKDAGRLRLGKSPVSQLSVKSQLGQELPVSLELALLAVVLTTLIGVPLGVIAATHSGKIWDSAIRVVLLSIFSVPVFVSGILFLFLGAKYLGYFYEATYVSLGKDIGRNLRCMTLPVVAIALPVSAFTMQMTRSAMLDALSEPHIQMAYAKGVKRWRIHYIHALKNALPTVLTLQGFLLGIFLGGLVLVENIFSLPGLGRGVLTAISQRDFQLLIPQVLVIAAFFVISNTAVEIIHPMIDKRVIRS